MSIFEKTKQNKKQTKTKTTRTFLKRHLKNTKTREPRRLAEFWEGFSAARKKNGQSRKGKF